MFTSRSHRRFERRIAMLTCGLALIALSCGVALAWVLPLDPVMRGLLVAALIAVLIFLCRALMQSVVNPLRALANVVEAYRGGDYTLRGNHALAGDALGDLVQEINSLGNTLHEQRLRAMEATALLDKLVSTIDVAVLAFDGDGKLSLLNPAAAQLLGSEQGGALGKSAAELRIAELLADSARIRLVSRIAGRAGRWQITHGVFREGGLAQHLLVISDVREVLREEERGAWQRLIRVISHEVNNSLAPIKSLAGTLGDMLAEALPGGRVRDDVLPALNVIAERTDSLQRFLAQHTRLARLPAPRRKGFALRPLLERVARLEHACAVRVEVEAELEAEADEDQLEQALINLVKNAIEAQGEAGGMIEIAARTEGRRLLLTVADEGPGIANPDNLFVPFFTTKQGGSGIGLTVSRQIAEAHGGTLSLESRPSGSGAVATLEIPATVRPVPEHRSVRSASGPGAPVTDSRNAGR